MTNERIDIVNSLIKNRLIVKTLFINQISNIIYYSTLVSSFPFSTGLLLFAQIKNNGNLLFVEILFILMLLFSGLLLYTVLNHNKLKIIQGISKEQNIEFTLVIIEKLGWKILTQNQQLIITRPSGRWYSSNFNREIVLLFDKQDILINCSYYGLYDFQSPFHWFGNRKLERQLLKEFEQKINIINQ